MMVPGAYFRDETIWRGRMIEFACDLKATLYELGLVSCTSRLSCNWKGYQWPWAWAYALRCFLAKGQGVDYQAFYSYALPAPKRLDFLCKWSVHACC